MPQKFGYFFRRFLRGRAGELGSSSRSHAIFAVARITGFAVVYFFAGRGERIEHSDDRRGQRTRGRLWFKRLAHELLGFLVLFGHLFRDRRIETILAFAQQSEGDKRGQNCQIDPDCHRALPRSPFQTPIDKRKRNHQDRGQRGNDDDSYNGERALKIFQPLENRQVVPFGTRNVLSISRVCLRSQLCRIKM